MDPITCSNPGCVVFLIDESAAMAASFPRSTKSMAESVATALNALLAQLANGPDFLVGLAGYRTDSAGNPQVGSRWGGALAGRDLVSTLELAGSPLKVETRTRRLEGREEAINFSVWYDPTLGTKAPQAAAYEYGYQLLAQWLEDAGPSPGLPLLTNVAAGPSSDGDASKAVAKIQGLSVSSGHPLVFHAHLNAAEAVPPTLYPSNRAYVPLGLTRDLFERSSPLPSPLLAYLKEAKLTLNAGARGMIYNAKLADLIRFFSLVRAYTQNWPSRPAAPLAQAAAAPAPTPSIALPSPADMALASTVVEATTAGAMASATLLELDEAAPPLAVAAPEPVVVAVERTTNDSKVPDSKGLVVLIIDRSIEDPASPQPQNAYARLQERANELLGEIAKAGQGALEAAILSYGAAPNGETEIRSTFEGPLGGRTFVRDSELAEGALHVNEVQEEVPNGIGGTVNVKRRKLIYLDLEPTGSARPLPAFNALQGLLTDWSRQHPEATVPPIVLHLTRGRLEPAEMEESARLVQQCSSAAGPALLYHLLLSESPHPSVAYPAKDDDLRDDAFRKLWELSSLLARREQLAEKRPSLAEQSRGFVINGKFDLLTAELSAALGG
jgi:hypothetical protein